VPGDKVSRVSLQALHHILAGQAFEVYKREIVPDVHVKTIENAARILERRFFLVLRVQKIPNCFGSEECERCMEIR
jgi:hypothetical protein